MKTLNEIPLMKSIPIFNNWKINGGIWVNDKKFIEEVINKAMWFNAITFTVDINLLKNCRKLICGVWPNQDTSNIKTEIRLAKNIHTKLYIVKNKYDYRCFYIGSMNLVQPSYYHNIMLRIDNFQHEKTLELYFNHLWNLAKD